MITNIVSGRYHSFAWNSTYLYAFGDNSYGQLGLGDTVQRDSPTNVTYVSGIIQVSTFSTHTLVLITNGSVLSFGNNDVRFYFT